MELLKRLLPSVCLVLLVAVFFAGCRNMQESYVYGGKISGTVVLIGVINGDYQGVSVNITSTGGTSAGIKTTATGIFGFTDLPDSTYTVVAKKSGYSTVTVNNIMLQKSGSWSDTLTLTPGSAPPPPIE